MTSAAPTTMPTAVPTSALNTDQPVLKALERRTESLFVRSRRQLRDPPNECPRNGVTCHFDPLEVRPLVVTGQRRCARSQRRNRCGHSLGIFFHAQVE